MSATHAAPSSTSAGTAGVDPREVAYYEQLASTWWDRSGPFWPLHRLNELRSGWLADRLADAFGRDRRDDAPLRGLVALDVGCGGGILSESIARLGAEVHGIDVVGRNIEIARRHAAASGAPVCYEETTVAALGARQRRYDVVLNMEVVEHVPDVAAFVGECARLVRPGGVMAVATINRTALSWLLAIVGAEYVLRWLPRGTHRWDRFVTPREIEALLGTGGLDVVDRTGVRVNPINREFALTRITAVNYMLLARRRGASGAGESGRGGDR